MKRFIIALFILSIGCHSVEHQAPLGDENSGETVVVFAEAPEDEAPQERSQSPRPTRGLARS